MALLEKTWENIQKKTFTKWCTMHLGKRGKKIENIDTDFSDGILLIELLEIIGAESLGKYNKNPKMRIHNVENLNVALRYVASKGVKLVGISAEDIVDKNLKLILGMVWTIILRFAIADISEEELNAKEALLLWCKKKTNGYRDVLVENFTNSWQDGLALCALIHAHRPDLIPYDTLDKENKADNLRLAFEVAEKEFGIPQLLDVEDIVDVPKPDERSVMTYIAQFYHYFAANRKNEVAGRRIGTLIDINRANEELKQDYNNKAGAHVGWVKDTTQKLANRDFDNTLEGIKKLLDEFNAYKTNEKPPKVADRQGLENLHNIIQAKLSSQGRPPFVPDAGLSVEDIAQRWEELERAEQARQDALLAELARQQLLDLLAQRFNNKANQLEDWIAKQANYLNADDDVDTVSAAEQRLKALEAFRNEYETAKLRLKELHGIKDEYVSNDGKDKDAITDRANRIQSAFDNLADLASKKNSGLDDALRRQREMEELRKKFANAAKEYNWWVKDTTNDVASTAFPDTLEGITQYRGTLDSENNNINSTNDSKKAHLDDLWQQEIDLGIKDNQYTVFTNQDIANWHKSVGDSLQEREKAYQAELEVQKRNEEKRKEFAAEADAFVSSLDARRSEIGALQGEPQELIAAIKAHYAEGAPEQEKLGSLTAKQEELSNLGIRENRHTKYTIPILKVKNDQLVREVRNRIAALEQEDARKKEYNDKARAFVSWVDETIPTIQGSFDNTLQGALQVKAKWNDFKTTTRTQKNLDRINLESLFNIIQAAQDANGRPAFVPDAGNSVADINAKWANFSEAERAWENAINVELDRQEKLDLLVRHFNSEAEVLANWANDKEAYLNQSVEINSLDSARVQLILLSIHDEDYEGSLRRLANVKTRAAEIQSLNYHDYASVDARVQELDNKWNALKNLASAKRASIEAERVVQEQKENYRLDFADKAKAFLDFVRDAKSHLDDYSFGTTLEDVTDFSAKLDQSDSQYNQSAQEKKAAVEAAANLLSQHGISDNKHTSTTTADIEAAAGELQVAIADRRTAYNAELQRQQDNDAARKQFAEQITDFVNFINETRANVKSVQGTPEEKTQKVKEIFQEGAPHQARLQELVTAYENLRSKGIYSNPYTPHTVQGTQKLLQQLVDSVNSSLSFFVEEQDFNKREVENEKEFQRKQQLEQRRLDFEFECQQLITALDSVNDAITDPINVSSVAGVNDLIAAFHGTEATLSAKKADYDKVLSDASALNADGVSVTTEQTSAKWNATQSNVQERKAALDSALATQQSNEQLSKNFAEKAGRVDEWIHKSAASLQNASGSLEDQLEAVRALSLDEGRVLLDELAQLATALEQAGVRTNPFTELNLPSLSARVDELSKSRTSKESVLEKDILQKKHSQASPEQIEEFKEVFKHFDRNNSGSLNKLEFKSCLNSLGQDVTDSGLDKLYGSLADKDAVVNGENVKVIGFEKFVEYMIKATSDNTTPDEIISAFRDLAADKDFITEADLQRSGMPTEKVTYLLSTIPPYAGVEGGLDYKAWAHSAFK